MTKKYTAIIDIDTLIIHAALAGQETSVIVRHKETNWERIFKNQTEFFGHHIKKEGGWLGELNTKRDVKVSPDCFEIIPVVSLIEEENGVSPEAIVKGRFKSKIEAITNQDWCGDFKIAFGTGKSFRYDIAETTPYKANRPSKPLLYNVVKEYMLWKYKDHMLIYDGVESDEIVTQEMWNAWLRSGRNFDNLDTVGCYIDKDLTQYPCLWYNFDKPELGLVKIEPLDAAKNLAKQMLKGDTIDSIVGLSELPKEMYEKYRIRKATKPGLGEKTAQALIDPCTTLKQVFERVVEAYKGYYGEGAKEFISFRGEVSQRCWLDHLNEQWRLLRMRSDVSKDVGNVSEFLNKLGVDY